MAVAILEKFKELPRMANTFSMMSQSLSSGSMCVRLVKMFHVAAPAEHPEVFELRSDLDGDEQDK